MRLSQFILFPYWLTLRLRHRAYDRGLLRSRKWDVPVICVGNIAAGGTGKTPVTELLCSLLKEEKRVAVLSRGYRRRSTGFRTVSVDSTADEVGDEPLQIKRKYPEITVAVDRRRARGIDRLLSLDERPDVILLDDGFQHRSIRPKVNILLSSWSRPLWKDELLPLGRLRDLPSQVARADALIITKCPAYVEEIRRDEIRRRLHLREDQELFFATLCYQRMKAVFAEGDPRYTYSKRVFLFSGIANPKPLQLYLYKDFDQVRHRTFGDHHRFTRADIRSIERFSRRNPTSLLLTTEKDACRLLHVQGISIWMKERLFYIPVSTCFIDEDEAERFSAFIRKNV